MRENASEMPVYDSFYADFDKKAEKPVWILDLGSLILDLCSLNCRLL